MNVAIAIIDQRLNSLMDEIRTKAKEELKITDNIPLKSLAFVYLVVKTVLDLNGEQAFDCLTEGGGDFGIDAMHIAHEQGNEFTVTIFQGKYQQNLSGKANFPENGIQKLIHAIRYLFDPTASLTHINRLLYTKVEEVRSLIRDGYIPQVRVIACNNGLKWTDSDKEEVKRAAFGPQVTFEHCNHDSLLHILQETRPVNETIQFTGKAIVEDFNFSRVFVGRVAVAEIARLIERHGDRLLERNIRRYLGLQGNRVNENISNTLQSEDSNNFYFYNNGITLICDKFIYNGLQSGNYQTKIENLQIINGGQTCITIHETLKRQPSPPENAFVLVRLYELPFDNEELAPKITLATNSQNPVDLQDLRANDQQQRQLEIDIDQLGFIYRRKRAETPLQANEFTIGTAAEAVLSVWRQKPHQAKFFGREHFGRLYDEIFTSQLNGTQVIIAVLLYRIAENYRRRPEPTMPPFVSYASCFLAMQMGKSLLQAVGLKLADLDHRHFQQAKTLVENSGTQFFHRAVESIDQALRNLYGDRPLSAQQLSATFRRGDLMDGL